MTQPTMPLPGPQPTLGASPADQGNLNAPANPTPQPPQSGTIVDSDPNNYGLPTATIEVNGKLITLTLNSNIKGALPVGEVGGPGKLQTVQSALNSITNWYQNSTTRQKYIDEMYAAGLITSKKNPGVDQVAHAWQLVVQESALQIQDPNGDIHLFSPDQVLAKAAQVGWNAVGAKQSVNDVSAYGTGNSNNSQETSSQSETVYKSFIDPASAMGALADAYYRLMGRNPTSAEYKAFLDNVTQYQEDVNTGKYETKTKGPDTGQGVTPTGLPVDQTGTSTSGTPQAGTSTITNTVAQRGLGQRGLEFLAGQSAMANPDEANYQAATTVFKAILTALGPPGAGLTGSGPTVTAP